MPFKIGPINLGIKLTRLPQNWGELLFKIRIFPDAKKYTSIDLDKINLEEAVSTFEVAPIEYSERTLSYGNTAIKEMTLWRCLANSASSDAVRAVERIQFFHQFRLDIKTASYGLLGEIMRMVSAGSTDDFAQLDIKDISETTVEERAIVAERLRLERMAALAHEEEERRRLQLYQKEQALVAKFRKQAELTSFALLFSRLNVDERAEAESRKQVTVRTPTHGDFVIPMGHGHVHQVVENRCVASYCLMFEDGSIPIYDTILMKILLLKNDPQKFISTANKFPVTFPTSVHVRWTRGVL